MRVQLPVEDDRSAFAGHRLVPTGAELDDRETRVPEPNVPMRARGNALHADVIGTAVPNRANRAPDVRFLERPRTRRDADDAAHARSGVVRLERLVICDRRTVYVGLVDVRVASVRS